ncbi:MAG: bifunctional N(6)-L-threonylcarbamoyladenine synthase/serine/threonine protein kinase [Candidatus Woesearchaeota archaeon]
MIVLGIESTAHTFGVGIVFEDVKKQEKKILSNVRDIYTTKTGGLIPVKMAEHHLEVCDKLYNEALNKANISINEVDAIAFSIGPGIAHSLRIGSVFAKSLSLKYNKPLIGVNHCIAHLEIGRLLFSECKDPVLLYVSGANTQVIAYENGKYRIFGETLDIGIGNLLDSVAREFGLGFPGGPKIEELAKKSSNYIELPYVVKGMDVSFGGVLTNLKNKLKSNKYKIEDLAYSLQETSFSMLVEVSERAMAHCDKNELIIGGGVGCNKRLKEMCSIMCKDRNAKFFAPPNEFLVDNGLMIAWLGLLMYKNGITIKTEEAKIKPYERTDDVEVRWRD